MKKFCLGLLILSGIVSAAASAANLSAMSYPAEVGVINRSEAPVIVKLNALANNAPITQATINAHGAGNLWTNANIAMYAYITDTAGNLIFRVYACPHVNLALDTIGNSLTLAIDDAKGANGIKIDPNCESRVL